MTLDEMLALLPDNNSGQIGADDLRTIVTGLYEFAAAALLVGYKWDRDDTPGQQQAAITPDWAMGPGTLLLSKITSGALAPSWDQIAGAVQAGHYIRIRQNADVDVHLVAQITGAHVEATNWWTVPVKVVEVSGAEPANGTDMTIDIEFSWSAP
jgi:hypothetical protein